MTFARLAAHQGYVETLLGRRRYFPNLKQRANPDLTQPRRTRGDQRPHPGTRLLIS